MPAPSMKDRYFYLYDTQTNTVLGNVNFSIPNVEHTVSELNTAIYNATGVNSGQSTRLNDYSREVIKMHMKADGMVAACPEKYTINGNSYFVNETEGYEDLIEGLGGISNFKNMYFSTLPRYRILVDENSPNDNYFQIRFSKFMRIDEFKYNGVEYGCNINIGFGVFDNNASCHLGLSCITSDNAFYNCELFSSSDSMNIEYGGSVLSEATFNAIIDLYNMAVIGEGFSVTYDLNECTANSENPTKISPASIRTRFNFILAENAVFTDTSCWISGKGITSEIPIYYTFDPETGDLVVGAVSSDIVIHIYATGGDPYSEIDGEKPLDSLPGAGSISMPNFPTLTAVSSGIIGLFVPSVSQMNLLASYMWTDFGGQGSTEVDVLKEVVEAIKRTISNPLDYVFGLNIVPSQGLQIGESATIRFGFTDTGISMPRLANQFFTVDCGTLSFDTVCGNTFLDYAPYSKFSIYLPYIGVREVDANDFVGHTIGVQYHGDALTGGITAYITKDGSVMYQYSGSCIINVPLSADSWGTTISSAVQIATSIIGGGLSSGAAGITAAAAAGAASVAGNPSLLSPSIARSGAVSGSAGCMGVQIPFIIREAVSFHSTAGFNTVSGYPSYYYLNLNSAHGYTEVYDVHLENIFGTSEEVAEIESLLKQGVIF